MNTEQAIAYGTEEWWEYLRGNMDSWTLVQRLKSMGLRTTVKDAQEARMRDTWLWVTDAQGLNHTLPVLSY